MRAGGALWWVTLAVALGSLPLLLLPPLGFYVAMGALLLWRWARGPARASGLRAVTRVVVWAVGVVQTLWLLLGVGLCGPRLLVFVCDA